MRVYIKSVLPKKSTSLWAEIISKTYNNDIFEPLTKLTSWPQRGQLARMRSNVSLCEL